MVDDTVMYSPALKVSIAMGEEEKEMGPVVWKMNHVNDQYKTASKHVRMHCVQAAAKPKSNKGKAKAAPKASALPAA